MPIDPVRRVDALDMTLNILISKIFIPFYTHQQISYENYFLVVNLNFIKRTEYVYNKPAFFFLFLVMDIRTERSWMYDRLYPGRKGLRNEFIEGVEHFISVAMQLPSFRNGGLIRCPCSKHRNMIFFEN